MADLLPRGRQLAEFHAFYKSALLNRDGTATLTLLLPDDMKDALLAVSDNDGMALRVTVHETRLPEGEDWLAAALGIDPPVRDPAINPVIVPKG